jgi:hypothetical protein
MSAIHRRDLLRGGAALGLAAYLPLRPRDAHACAPFKHGKPALAFTDTADASSADMARRFLRWLRSTGVSSARPVHNLVFNFVDAKTRTGTWIYPMLSGKSILWLVQRGLVEDATAIADTLLGWQQFSKDGKLARSYGAFPSKIDQDPNGTWKANDYFYSGDNLVILAALLALYGKTKAPELLNAAIGIGTWLTEVMCKGHKLGMWTEDHAAPMYMVRASGDFVNSIATSEEMLWMSALHRLGRVTKESAYCSQAERAFRFLLGSQLQNGVFLDRYDPGYPPKPYDAGRWKPYQAGQIVGDSVLRCALGACRWGELARARKLFDWLKTESGAVPAFLDMNNGGPGFPSNQRVYYDLTSSALHRTLAGWLGKRNEATQAQAFLRKTQGDTGGWYWGVYKDKLAPVDSQLAPIVGFWATADLSIEVE